MYVTTAGCTRARSDPLEGETGALQVYAAAAGEVVCAGSESSGLVVIIKHPDGLFPMYGHLDYALAVETGQSVECGQRLGSILTRTDDLIPSNLHFEMRTFFTTPQVNGNAPRYGVACGFDCPPGSRLLAGRRPRRCRD